MLWQSDVHSKETAKPLSPCPVVVAVLCGFTACPCPWLVCIVVVSLFPQSCLSVGCVRLLFEWLLQVVKPVSLRLSVWLLLQVVSVAVVAGCRTSLPKVVWLLLQVVSVAVAAGCRTSLPKVVCVVVVAGCPACLPSWETTTRRPWPTSPVASTTLTMSPSRTSPTAPRTSLVSCWSNGKSELIVWH